MKTSTQRFVDALLVAILVGDAIVMYEMLNDQEATDYVAVSPAAESYSAAANAGFITSILKSTVSLVPLPFLQSADPVSQATPTAAKETPPVDREFKPDPANAENGKSDTAP